MTFSKAWSGSTSTTTAKKFSPSQNYAAVTGPTGVANGDCNADGRPDLAVADGLGRSTSILLNLPSANDVLQGMVWLDLNNDRQEVFPIPELRSGNRSNRRRQRRL